MRPVTREHNTDGVLERRCRQYAALAELSQLAITAPQVEALLPHAVQIVRSFIDIEIDVPAILSGQAVASGLDDDDASFLESVREVLRKLETQRQQELMTLAEVERRFARIFRHSPVALGMSTIADGRILDVNDRWLSMFGYQRHEVIGRTNAELGINVEPARRAELVKEVAAGGVVRDAEMQVRTKSGAVLDILASAMQLGGAAGEPVWISASVEITDRKRNESERAEMLLREQIARAEAEQALEKLNAVYAMNEGVSAQGPLGELLVEVLRRLRQTLQVDHASVLVLDESRRILELRAIEGVGSERPVPNIRVPVGSGVSGRVAAEGKPLIVVDYAKIETTGIETTVPEVLKIASAMCAPFRIGGNVAGVVVVSARLPRHFTSEELRLLTFAADRVGPAIERGRLIERIRSGIARQRVLSHRLLTAQEEERRRVAVELHDELGQILTAVKINLESLELGRPSHPLKLASMIESVDDALQRVKDIALDLRPAVLDDLGLGAALRWFADRCARDARVVAHVSIDTLPPLAPNVQTACFRVAQEALTNIERHARARQFWIDLHVLDGSLELSVRDDGIGFDVAAARTRAMAGSSVGILGMQERVALMGGEYDLVRIPTGGTEVRARFPLAVSEVL